jgi:3-deoxy-7-phosphoheptulonate synthase
MILVLNENTDPASAEYAQLIETLSQLPDVSTRVHRIQGTERAVTEIYLIGDTKALQIEDMRALPCVEQAIRVSEEYRVLGRHKDDGGRPISNTRACVLARTRCMCLPACARSIRRSMSRR